MQPIENTPPVPAEPLSIVTTATTEVTATIATTSVAAPVVKTPTTAALTPTPVTTPSIATLVDEEPKQPKLFEAPLVVTGKRPRKPSHKLIEKLADEDIQVKSIVKKIIFLVSILRLGQKLSTLKMLVSEFYY